MTRIFLIALGFVLAGFVEVFATVFASVFNCKTAVNWVLGAVYALAVGVVIARLVFCWGGCGA